MTAIFISHRSVDKVEAHELRDWLVAQGHEQLFLDFDPMDGIPAGVEWEQWLYRQLRRCQALLIVLTPAWLESKWCSNELAIAREKGKAIFVVRVAPCPGHPIIPSIQEVDLTSDRNDGLQKLARGLREHGLDPRSAFDWKPDRPIYPGFAAFDVEDAATFFGRSEESVKACEELRRLKMQAIGSPKLLLIAGASGSGKSSVMQAGLLARLLKEPAIWIVSRPIRAGASGIVALARAIARVFPAECRPSVGEVASRLAKDASELLELARKARQALDRPEATLVIALDQAEEVLNCSPESIKFLNLIREALARTEQEIVVVATLRSDQLGKWQKHKSITTPTNGELAFKTFPLGPMSLAKIGDIVRRPAEYVELTIDDALVDAFMGDTSSPDALPLLAYTLRTLNEIYGTNGRLTLDDYTALGGLEGTVRNQADAAIEISKLGEEDLAALRDAFVPGLVRATADGAINRNRALLDALPKRALPYLHKLIDARLLVLDATPEGQSIVEVAHEALLRAWPLLEGWIWQDAENLRRLEAIQRAAKEYEQNRQGRDFLIHLDQRLAAAEALAEQTRFAANLSSGERSYLAACRTLQNDRERQSKRRMALTLFALVIILGVAGVGTFFAYGRQQESNARLLDEAASIFRAGDLAGALVPLEKLHTYPSVLRPRDSDVLRTFWSDRMTPLSSILDKAGPLSVIEINDRPAVTLADGTVHVPKTNGRPLISYEPVLGAFMVADSRTISIHDQRDFKTLLEIDQAEQAGAQRVTPLGIFRLEAFGLAVHTRTLEVTNDEDEPEEWHAGLTYLFPTNLQTPEDVCLEILSDDSTNVACQSNSSVVRSGFAAVVREIRNEARIETVASEIGPALMVQWTTHMECDFDEKACVAKDFEHVELTRIVDGQLLIDSEVARDKFSPDKTLVAPSITRPSFPHIRGEDESWRLAGAPTATDQPVPRPPMDFSALEDGERYAALFEGVKVHVMKGRAEGGVIWTSTVGGNSWLMYVTCRFDESGHVAACEELTLTALNVDTIVSPDERFVVQRVCSGFEPAIQALDMLKIEHVQVAAPIDFVLGLAISYASDQLVAITDQNEILVYSLTAANGLQMIRRSSLPRESVPTGEDACKAGRPLHFVDGSVVVGVSIGGHPFAIDTANGEIRWFGGGTWENADRIAVSPDGHLFALHDRESVQLMSSRSGLPLSSRFSPGSLVIPLPDTGVPLLDTVEVDANGELRLRCALCEGQVFVRDPPNLGRLSDCRLELLTGRNAKGVRLEPEALLAMPRAGCHAP